MYDPSPIPTIKVAGSTLAATHPAKIRMMLHPVLGLDFNCDGHRCTLEELLAFLEREAGGAS
jgi:hypothetical protein